MWSSVKLSVADFIDTMSISQVYKICLDNVLSKKVNVFKIQSKVNYLNVTADLNCFDRAHPQP